MEHFDVIIIGAGMSGIQSAYYLQRDCPDIDGPQTNLPLQSNYFIRSKGLLPKRTWQYGDNYFKEWIIFKFCNLKKGMIFK